MEFVGRTKEKVALSNFLSAPGFGGAVVYGRRRLGKTSLIKEALKSFQGPVLFYQCLNTKVESENVKGLLDVARLFFPNLLLSEKSTFQEILKALFILGEQTPMVLVLDEYPYLRDGDRTDSMIQSLIDSYQKTSSLKLILCGSYVGIMREVVDESHPLFGRMILKIKLAPFDYYDAALMLPFASPNDKFRYYATLGGVPYYLEQIDASRSFEENLKALLLKEFAPLASEIVGGISAEFSKIANASFIMGDLTHGLSKYQELKSSFKDHAQGDFDYCLNTLMAMDLVAKNGTLNGNDKRAYYTIADNLFDFYYSCVYPFLQYRDLVPTDDFFKTYVEPALQPAYLARKFERVAYEFLLRRNRLGKNDPSFTGLGRYVYNDRLTKTNGEFDVVSRDPKGYIFYECKYSVRPLGLTVVHEEERQLAACHLPYYRLGFFSRSGFDSEVSSGPYLCYSLEDLYA